MTEPNSTHQPYQGIPGSGGPYAQSPYGQASQNPYGTGPGAYGPPARRVRKPVLLLRLGVLVAVLIIGGVTWLVGTSHKSQRAADGSISKGGNLDAVSLRVGDCYEQPADDPAGFDSVKAIPCTQPHNSQAFASFPYPGATSAAPTESELTANAEPLCESAAKTKVDQAKLPQSAQPSLLYADASTWAKGYHDITCVYENDSDFTGSVLKS